MSRFIIQNEGVVMTEEVFKKRDDLINRLTTLALAGEWVFRGYNIQDQLRPNILRHNLSDVECELLFEFERYGAQYINASNPVDFMSYAQHFGLPTRLLDFTYNPFIALYFSLFSPKSNTNYRAPDDKEYYYIRYASIKENILIKNVPYLNKGASFEINSMAQRSIALIRTVYTMFSDFVLEAKDIYTDKLVESFFKSIEWNKGGKDIKTLKNENMHKIHDRVILFIDPNQSNQRLVMQQGLFMFPYTLDGAGHLEILDRNSNIIKIHKSLREDLLAYLDTLGINAFRIMPDLPSVCEAIVRKTKDKRNSKSMLFKKKSKGE